MKHLKIYNIDNAWKGDERKTQTKEEILNYHVDDFIRYHIDGIKLHIVNIDQKYHKKLPYQVERSNGSLGWISEKQIKRYLTNTEIKEFLDENEMYKNVNKYNL